MLCYGSTTYYTKSIILISTNTKIERQYNKPITGMYFKINRLRGMGGSGFGGTDRNLIRNVLIKNLTKKMNEE